ncbi:MAG TPA: hypothetical protein VGF99_21040 [Myxococcota bacterium]
MTEHDATTPPAKPTSSSAASPSSPSSPSSLLAAEQLARAMAEAWQRRTRPTQTGPLHRV